MPTVVSAPHLHVFAISLKNMGIFVFGIVLCQMADTTDCTKVVARPPWNIMSPQIRVASWGFLFFSLFAITIQKVMLYPPTLNQP